MKRISALVTKSTREGQSWTILVHFSSQDIPYRVYNVSSDREVAQTLKYWQKELPLENPWVTEIGKPNDVLATILADEKKSPLQTILEG